MKQEILERLEAEVNACKRYAENTVKKAKKKLYKLLTFQIYQQQQKCADILHDEFWKVLDGKLTQEEFKIFCETKTLS